MRLLLLTNYFPPDVIGGYELWCHDMASELASRGHQVTVLTSHGEKQPSASDESEFTVRRELELEVRGGTTSTIHQVWNRHARAERNARTVRRTIDETQPDAAMIWGMWNLSRSVPAAVEQALPTRTTYYLCDYWPTLENACVQQLSNPAKRGLTAAAKRALAAPLLARLRREETPRLRLDQAACCSRYLRDNLVEAGVLPPTASVIHGGINPTAFPRAVEMRPGPPSEPARLLYFGRIVPEKGVETAIEAVASLTRREGFAAVELSILGAGAKEYMRRLEQRAQELGVADRVRFVGEKSIDEIPAALQGFDICLFTSTWPEPFGRTIVEAMLAGLVVVGADVGGSREIFEQYDGGIVFRPGDAADLADRVARVIEQPELRRRLQRKGRELAEQTFSTLNMADGVERHLARVAAA